MFKPLFDKILIRPIENDQQKVGNLYIPDSAKEKPSEGEVLEVGTGVRYKDTMLPLSVKVGDIVVYEPYSVTPIKVEDEDLLIIREQNILGVK
jgi:chaperonin GroES